MAVKGDAALETMRAPAGNAAAPAKSHSFLRRLTLRETSQLTLRLSWLCSASQQVHL
jgi:hypothetical protein